MTTLRWCALVLLGGLAIDSRLAADPPEGFEGTFRLGEASAPPGGDARVPLYIRATPGMRGFAFSIDFDEELLEAGPEMEHVLQIPGSDSWYFAAYYVDNSNASAGNDGVDEGFLLGAVIFDIEETFVLPVDTEKEIVAFSMHVKPDAPIGTAQIRSSMEHGTHKLKTPSKIIWTWPVTGSRPTLRSPRSSSRAASRSCRTSASSSAATRTMTARSISPMPRPRSAIFSRPQKPLRCLDAAGCQRRRQAERQ
jgi:hypothetical protein